MIDGLQDGGWGWSDNYEISGSMHRKAGYKVSTLNTKLS